MRTLFILALQSAWGWSIQQRDSGCPSTSNIPMGHVETSSAYACKGQLEVFSNVTSGLCVDTKNFTTARGYRKGPTPEGIECSFNFYSSSGCKGPFVSAGTETNNSDWAACVRNFIAEKPVGDTSTWGSSFMYICFERK